MYKATIVLDSLASCGKRLITLEATYPRFIHAQVMTHRQFSRNAASSRAIPVKKLLEQVKLDPVIPIWWGKQQAGMQAESEIDDKAAALAEWLNSRDLAVAQAEKLLALGMHKQIVNRILEPFMWITTIISATEWENFFRLRRHDDAQPEITHIANLIHDSTVKSTPVEREWHLPWVQDDEQSLPLETKQKISTARSARVSYLTHDGKRDIEKDFKLYEHLTTGSGFGHWSPMEHAAQALTTRERSGNFVGWRQYRKTFENECAA